jgi:hypothetical protein
VFGHRRALDVSMPGFHYGFHCPACGEVSDDYPAYVFPDIIEPRIILPAWSASPPGWGEVIFRVPQADRARLEKDSTARAEFAARLSSAALTVGSPRLTVTPGGGSFAVEVTPTPICPWCGSAVGVWFGQPPASAKHAEPAAAPPPATE